MESGQNLLHYRLVDRIGEGGMGVVWRARDTTLDRDVAVKVLPPALAGDPERLARFEREARLLASLNHPNIAAIHGCHTGSADEPAAFLVMELVEGHDLAERLQRGPVPRNEALRAMIQVAEALEAAHDRGIVHRDLKPANVRLTPGGQAKVLDFGLAKALAPEGAAAGGQPSLSPTMTSAGTVAGMILGTAAYMSPEQAKGAEVDRRADVWAFGVVLYELLAGRRLFDGESISETLAAVLLKEIDLAGLPADTPGQVRRLLRRCLQRDPALRLRDVGEARAALTEALAAPEPAVAPDTRPAWRRLAPWAVAAAAVGLALAGWLLPREAPAPPQVMRFALSLPAGQELPDVILPRMALSPDGRRLVYIADDATGTRQLWVRRFDRVEPVALAGTGDASTPFFSPDGRWIAFEQAGKLKRIGVDGGPVTTVCDAPRLRGASWGSAGTIVLAPDRSTGLYAVPETGGQPRPITELEGDSTTLTGPSHRWPHVLPDGRTVLFTATSNNSDYTDAEIRAVSLDDGEVKTLVQGTYPTYMPPGYLLFARDTTLFAAPFDARRIELTGPAVPLVENVRAPQFFGVSQYSVSASGTLIYTVGGGSTGDRKLVWLDRDGREHETAAPVGPLGSIGGYDLSPDGRQIAASDGLEAGDLWLLDLDRGVRTRFTFEDETDQSPVWSADGAWIAYASFRGRGMNVFMRRADGSGDERQLTDEQVNLHPEDWSPDGKVLVLTRRETSSGDSDLLLLHLDPEPRLEPLLTTPYAESAGRISPDGKWLAYVSTETGEAEVYVRPLLEEGRKVRVSNSGGTRPRWSPAGGEMAYRRLVSEDVVVVSYEVVDGAFRPGVVRRGFQTRLEVGNFNFSPDGERLLVDVDAEGVRHADAPAVVVGWGEEVRRRVGGG